MTGFLVSIFSYSILFYLNDWLTSHLAYGLGVNWIYLPAGLRLFLTLVFGLSGAVGIALASFMICYFGQFPPELTTCIGIGLISGFAPYLARIFVVSNVNVSPDLSNLSLPKLALCILIYALLSAGLHQWWFAVRGLDETGSFNHFLVMLLGDVLGTVLLVGLIKAGLDLLKRSQRA
ncbi:hypothetical protein [Polynucleobacter sp. es-MAR-4]|uniref:hypothetical protein n=1 Tax=Polynucleobacter sp. es-MAR-4 TaxID=1855655 RepID=UPI001C0B2BC1|nr:hypothetical protein [Polynucleobacter sp. es-MAR-4]MBU3637752.1 hypothetical protein [Polynucleobacter sp. es-MAR-4]